MNKKNIHYGITLSEQQMEWIRSKKYKIDRMECFMSLVPLAERETKLVQVSKTQQVEILAGQFMVDNTQLAAMWGKDRKTVPKLLEAMEALGISSSQKVGEYRVHTLHSLAGWYVDGTYQKNPLSSKRSADGSQIIPMDVPPARVITIEADAQQKTDAESGQSDDTNSADANSGKNTSSTANPLPQNPQSNDGGDVGKSDADTKSSFPSVGGTSPQAKADGSSAAAPSPDEADGKQNEGKPNVGGQQSAGGHQPYHNGGYRPSYNGSGGNGSTGNPGGSPNAQK